MAKRSRPDGGFNDFGSADAMPVSGFGFDDPSLGMGMGLPGGLGNINMDMDLGALGPLDFGNFPAVKLRGLPFAVNEGDIYAFLVRQGSAGSYPDSSYWCGTLFFEGLYHCQSSRPWTCCCHFGSCLPCLAVLARRVQRNDTKTVSINMGRQS